MHFKFTDDDTTKAGFISFRRLFTDVLRQTGELHPNETVARIVVGDNGINYFVSEKEAKK